LDTVNLTISQFSLLNDIRLLKSCNKSELAHYTKLDRTTIIRNLSILRKRGLIADAPGTDKRNTLIELTDLGRSAIAAGMIPWERAQDQVKTAVGSDDIENFMRILTNMEQLRHSACDREDVNDGVLLQ
jgi:DNA-binding MarR family transcriptional regulator